MNYEVFYDQANKSKVKVSWEAEVNLNCMVKKKLIATANRDI